MNKYQIIHKYNIQKDNILQLWIKSIINGNTCSNLLRIINNEIKRLYMGGL